ncbi:NRDE family protein [Bacillus sp. H-16]|uniref:NRDE family protein n=1 Tax=Alteribacter salitolerans TaxID=2912333 RepID=UPI001965B57A|nr:NRDE family protein [Alteribacter salitolerans]MBM7094581.1 NRDE family protein [Alteribacter salitolerans]
MCLIGISMKKNTKFPFILAANRDEFYARPTESLHRWEGYPVVYAGKDLKKGGTWLGVSETGCLGALTNVRERQEREARHSRGELIVNFLRRKDTDACTFVKQVSKDGGLYDGFNLLVGTPDTLCYGSNRVNGIKVLESGIYGLSNAALDTSWPKVEAVKDAMDRVSACEDQEELLNMLFSELAAAEPFPSELLPDTGFGEKLERMLSPVFISSEDYGTRCSTIIIMNRNRELTIVERRYHNKKTSDTKFALAVP